MGALGSGYFHWNYKTSTIIQRKGFDKETNKFFAETLYRYSYNYMPYDPWRKEGKHMADNVRIQSTKNGAYITYLSKYARRLHEGKGMKFNHIAHPLATSHWEQAAWRQHKNEIVGDVDIFRKLRSKKNSGK